MVETELSVEGLPELEEALMALGADLGAKALRSALMASANPMRDDMKANAPEGNPNQTYTVVDTKGLDKRGKAEKIQAGGWLKKRVKKSSRIALMKNGKTRRGFGPDEVAIVKVGVHRAYYAYFAEYGTSKVAAKPFIRPAVRKSDEVLALFKVKLAKRIETVRRKQAKNR